MLPWRVYDAPGMSSATVSRYTNRSPSRFQSAPLHVIRTVLLIGPGMSLLHVAYSFCAAFCAAPAAARSAMRVSVPSSEQPFSIQPRYGLP